MRIKNLNFETWKKNHEETHDDKWCRELYPFRVFSRIDFSDDTVGTTQKIEQGWVHYYVIIKKIELQENKRYRTNFEISTHPPSKRQAWKNRSWNTTFQIVYTQDFNFVTIFTKKEDPTKEYIVKFMNANFDKISLEKSLPLSELLFRTLLLQLSEENYLTGKHNEPFTFLVDGVRNLPEHPEFKRKKLDFAPIYSVGRDLWICYSFSEEKAHRIAYFIANQCKELIVVYCNPTYTRHQRCKYEKTTVLSLYEFANNISPTVRIKYERQIRFLQNHLNKAVLHSPVELLKEINSPVREVYEINKSDLMEAFGIMKIVPHDNLDFFYCLTGLNLINAYLSQRRQNPVVNEKDSKLFRNMYFFKTYLANILTDRIVHCDFSIPIFVKDGLAMIDIFDFQFSFHNVPINEILAGYERSENNNEILWTSKRLQPIAHLLFHYAQALRQHQRSITNK